MLQFIGFVYVLFCVVVFLLFEGKKSLSEARKNNKGAGIGLLLVKGFLEKNGGEIWVESIVGVGSSFYYTLPIEKPLLKIGSTDEIIFDVNA